MTQPKTHIVIVTYQTLDTTVRLIESLDRWVPSGRRTIALIDNGNDGTAERIKKRFGWVTVLANEKNLGFAAAVNQGVRVNDAPQVLLLNSDAAIDQPNLERLEEALEADSKRGVVGPKVSFPNGRLDPTRRGELSPANLKAEWSGLYRLFPKSRRWGDPYKTHTDSNAGQPVDFLKGACILIRRKAFEEAGAMDERFFLYCEEADLSRRMREAGWTIWYEPSAVAQHAGALSTENDPLLRLRYQWEALAAYQRKHYGPQAVQRARRIVMSGYWLRMALFGLASLGPGGKVRFQRARTMAKAAGMVWRSRL